MGKIFNKYTLKSRRKNLRQNQTQVEGILWGKLRNKQLGGFKFYRQYSVDRYILDFYCPKAKLAIEFDGSQHAKKENAEYDKVREKYLESVGIRVVRFWNNEVLKSPDSVLECVLELIV